MHVIVQCERQCCHVAAGARHAWRRASQQERPAQLLFHGPAAAMTFDMQRAAGAPSEHPHSPLNSLPHALVGEILFLVPFQQR